MTNLSTALFAASIGLALAAAFAGAQPAPKPQTTSPSQLVPAESAPAGQTCENPARPKAESSAGMHHGMMMKGPRHGKPAFAELASIAEIEVQTTKTGAVIRLVAKNAADTTRVQTLALELTTKLATPLQAAHVGPHSKHR